MNGIRCRILLAKGDYKRAASVSTVRGILQSTLLDSLASLNFADPEEDVAVEARVVALIDPGHWPWGHDEAVRDRMIVALLDALQPEYESMVEVEMEV